MVKLVGIHLAVSLRLTYMREAGLAVRSAGVSPRIAVSSSGATRTEVSGINTLKSYSRSRPYSARVLQSSGGAPASSGDLFTIKPVSECVCAWSKSFVCNFEIDYPKWRRDRAKIWVPAETHWLCCCRRSLVFLWPRANLGLEMDPHRVLEAHATWAACFDWCFLLLVTGPVEIYWIWQQQQPRASSRRVKGFCTCCSSLSKPDFLDLSRWFSWLSLETDHVRLTRVARTTCCSTWRSRWSHLWIL